MPLTKASQEIVFISTNPPDERVFILKDKEFLQQLPPTSTNVEASSLILQYSKRPKSLENWCLADFASKVTVTFPPASKPVDRHIMVNDDEELEEHDPEDSRTLATTRNGIIYTRRTNNRIIRSVRYSENNDAENFYREKLMLFMPWRNEECDLLAGYDSFKDHFTAVIADINDTMAQYEHHVEEINDAIAAQALLPDDIAPGAQEAQATDNSQSQEESLVHQFFNPGRAQHQQTYDIGTDIGLPPAQNETTLPAYRMTNEEFATSIRSLNQKQYEFYSHVMKYVKTESSPLTVFLSGGAGVGKSLVVNALREGLLRYYNQFPGENPNKDSVLVCAPTGKAAYNVNALTLHTALKINPNRGLKFSYLSADMLNTLRTTYLDLKVIIIDEISMVGNKMLNIINLRLQEIFDCKQLFAGKHLIFIGDLFQLQPVMDQWIFQDLRSGYTSLSPNTWTETITMHELTQIMRQQNDQPFAHLLNRLREGQHTHEDIDLLLTRKSSGSASNIGISTPRLYPTNALVDEYNTSIYNQCQNEKVVVQAHDEVTGDYSAEIKADVLRRVSSKEVSATGNLVYKLYVALELRYEITSNINLTDGLVNGTSCVLKQIQYIGNIQKPAILWVLFDKPSTGLNTRAQYRRFYTNSISQDWSPIFAHKVSFATGRDHKMILRTQFPLRPSSAKTIHKAQGDTMSQVAVHVGRRNNKHSHYVALSRVTNLSGLHILELNESRITVDPLVTAEMTRLRNERMLRLCYVPPYSLDTHTLKITLQNARSLHHHIADLKADHNHISADIIAVCETRLMPSDMDDYFSIPGYRLLRFDQPRTNPLRPPHGLAIYSCQKVSVASVASCSTPCMEYAIVTVSTNLPTRQSISLCLMYSSPKNSVVTLKAAIADVAQVCETQGHQLVLLGDLNVNLNDKSNINILTHLQQSLSCTQINLEATTDFNTLLDHAYTNIVGSSCATFECPWSDHKGLLFSVPHFFAV